jgi:hypothetical protein
MVVKNAWNFKKINYLITFDENQSVWYKGDLYSLYVSHPKSKTLTALLPVCALQFTILMCMCTYAEFNSARANNTED